MQEVRALLTRMVERSEVTAGPLGGLMWKAWEGWIRAREGDVAEGLRRLDLIAPQGMVRPLADIAGAGARLDAREFGDAPEFIASSRDFADSSGIDILIPHLDRLEGAVALGAGELDRAIGLMAGARLGFSTRDMPWEVARSDLWLAEARLTAGDPVAARTALDAALPVLERLGSLSEIDHARGLLRRVAEQP
jgi:hypothetical protein